MKTPLAALLMSSLALSACGGFSDSRMNPRNWFGASSVEERPELGPTTLVDDPRPLVPQVSEMVIERTSSGAIVRASAVMPSAGWWDAELVPENYGRPSGGVLSFRFVAIPPRTPVAGQNPGARTIVAVYALTQAQLDTTADIVVIGAENTRRARR